MDQIDNIGTICLNGREIASCEWRASFLGGKNGSILPIDITNQLRPGSNTVRFTLYNQNWSGPGGKYSYHFKLYKMTDKRGSKVLFERQGMRSDKNAGVRFDENYTFEK